MPKAARRRTDSVVTMPSLESPTGATTMAGQRVLERLRAEYLEMPGMKLTMEQIGRLCGIEPGMCRPVLDALVNVRFLRLNSDGTYVRVTEGGTSLPTPAKAEFKPRTFVTLFRRASEMPCSDKEISGPHVRSNRIAKNGE